MVKNMHLFIRVKFSRLKSCDLQPLLLPKVSDTLLEHTYTYTQYKIVKRNP